MPVGSEKFGVGDGEKGENKSGENSGDGKNQTSGLRNFKTWQPPNAGIRRTRVVRPVDPIMEPKPAEKLGSKKGIPESWRVVFDTAETWPYPDPDSEPVVAGPFTSFDDYPVDGKELAVKEARYIPDASDEEWTVERPWGRRAKETQSQYAMFNFYLTLGLKRTLKAVTVEFKVSAAHVSRVAADQDWYNRVRMFDDYRERVYMAELVENIKDMAQTHADTAKRGIEALSLAFDGIVEKLSTESGRADMIDELADLPVQRQLAIAQRTAAVLPSLMSAERLARGMPTEITVDVHAHNHAVTVQTTDELTDIITGLIGPLSAAKPVIVETEDRSSQP